MICRQKTNDESGNTDSVMETKEYYGTGKNAMESNMTKASDEDNNMDNNVEKRAEENDFGSTDHGREECKEVSETENIDKSVDSDSNKENDGDRKSTLHTRRGASKESIPMDLRYNISTTCGNRLGI